MNRTKIRGHRRAKSVKWWIPRLVFIATLCGFVAWIVWAYVCQKQLVWIPETTFWHRMSVCMGESWYIPLIFGAIGVISFILLEKKYGKKSK